MGVFSHPSVDLTSFPTVAATSDTRRIAELDALRGIGALLILGHHRWPSTFFFGWTRADLFFVISGFMITSITLKHGDRPRFLRSFWIRRALRIWPAYYLLLAILCVLAVVERTPLRLDSLLAHMTFTQNLSLYWSPEMRTFLGGDAVQTWSLAIEEQFYLVWPPLLLLAGRAWLMPIALWLITQAVVLRMLNLYPAVALARCDGLALGAILAAFLDGGAAAKRPGPWHARGLALVGLLALGFLVDRANRYELDAHGISGCGPLSILAVNVLYFSVVGLVALQAGRRWLSPLRNRALCYLGRISYGIFLYHMVIIHAVNRHLGPRTLVSDVVAVGLSLAAAAISWEYFEKPIAGLKDRFPYRSETDLEKADLDGGRIRRPAPRFDVGTPSR